MRSIILSGTSLMLLIDNLSGFKSVACSRPFDAVGDTGDQSRRLMVTLKRPFLRVVCAELVAEKVSCGRAPRIYVTIHDWERLPAVRAHGRDTVGKILRTDHHIEPSGGRCGIRTLFVLPTPPNGWGL